ASAMCPMAPLRRLRVQRAGEEIAAANPCPTLMLIYYQRDPPPLRPPPPRESVLGLASFTFRLLPPSSLESSAWIALRPSSRSDISMNPNPRDLLVNWSTMTLADTTSPYVAN